MAGAVRRVADALWAGLERVTYWDRTAFALLQVVAFLDRVAAKVEPNEQGPA